MFKKIFKWSAAGLIVLGLLATGISAFAQDFSSFRQIFKLSGTAIQPYNSTWTIGSAGSPIADGYFTALTAGTLTISSTVSCDLSVSGVIKASNGTAAAPSITFSSDTDTGIYRVAADSIGFTAGGVFGGRFTADLFNVNNIRTNSLAAINLTGNSADGAAAYGLKIGNANALSTAGAKIVGFFSDNVATEKAYVDKDGSIYSAGRMFGFKGADVASANNITLGLGNFFDITGTTQINTIAGNSWTAGSVVTLQFDASVTVAHNTAGTGARFLLASSANFSATVNDTLTLVYDGTYWREIGRTVI